MPIFIHYFVFARHQADFSFSEAGQNKIDSTNSLGLSETNIKSDQISMVLLWSVPQSYLQSDAPDLILDILSKIKIFWINLEIQNKFFWLSLQSKQKGDKPKARLNRLKEKHSLSGLWVPRNFCKEIVVLGNKQELKVGAQQKTLL